MAFSHRAVLDGIIEMSSKFWLRVASGISLFYALGHAVGGLKEWSPMGDNPVLHMMKANEFATMGVHRSYYDFFMGFGHSLTLATVTQAAILWLLGDLARDNPVRVRPLMIAYTVSSVVGLVITWNFIFPLPAAFSLVLIGALGAAVAMARPSATR